MRLARELETELSMRRRLEADNAHLSREGASLRSALEALTTRLKAHVSAASKDPGAGVLVGGAASRIGEADMSLPDLDDSDLASAQAAALEAEAKEVVEVLEPPVDVRENERGMCATGPDGRQCGGGDCVVM